MEDNPDTIIKRICGLYSLQMWNLMIFFYILESCFNENMWPHELYDIKGSWVNRNTNRRIAERKGMKDEDLNRTIILGKTQAEKLLQQLDADTCFLRDQKIMDYSLLLGIYYSKVVSLDKYNLETQQTEFLESKRRSTSIDAGGLQWGTDKSFFQSRYAKQFAGLVPTTARWKMKDYIALIKNEMEEIRKEQGNDIINGDKFMCEKA